jgi:hypothetical protein
MSNWFTRSSPTSLFYGLIAPDGSYIAVSLYEHAKEMEKIEKDGTLKDGNYLRFVADQSIFDIVPFANYIEKKRIKEKVPVTSAQKDTIKKFAKEWGKEHYTTASYGFQLYWGEFATHYPNGIHSSEYSFPQAMSRIYDILEII